MNKKFRLFNIFLILALFLGACNLPRNDPEDASATAAAQTVEALLSATPAFTETATPTLINTITPIPTGTVAASATPTCELARFVTDVTIPDGTVMAPNQNFNKKWRIRNIGACAWNGYTLMFDSGEAMGAPATKPIPAVGPGQEIDLEVDFKAPATPGTYRSYWRIVTNNNVLVPVVNGYQGRAFYVEIKVQAPATATSGTAQIILNPVESESGTVYEPAAGLAITNSILAGDTNSNHLARGFMSFNIATLSGKTIQSASLALGGCSQVRDPFTNLAGIWVGEVQYTLPLKQADYSLSGTGIVNLNSIPGSPIDVKSYVQTRVTEGKPRFQIRLHPASANSNGDNLADQLTCGANAVTLTIVYNP
jgi:hypothetical protein